MILISVLFALAFERLTTTTARWEMAFYAHWYSKKLSDENYLKNNSSELSVWGLMLIPAIVLGLVLAVLPGFFVFILQTLVLFVCLGNANSREAYRHYLTAASENDTEAYQTLSARLASDNRTMASAGEQEPGVQAGLSLLWINYRYFIGVILWFVVFGAPGALLYALVRELTQQPPLHSANVNRHMAKLMYALDFIPARVAALGMLVVGDFSRALPVWLSHLTTIDIAASRLVSEVALAAGSELQLAPAASGNSLLHSAQMLVRLAKRNLMLVIVFIALLTVLGWLS